MRKGRERSNLVWLYSIILWNCKYVTICSVFVLYEIMKLRWRSKKKKKHFFLSNREFFVWNCEKTYFLALGMGPNFGPKIRWSRALKLDISNVAYSALVIYLIFLTRRVVAQWLAHLPLVLEVWSPLAERKSFGVWTSFPLCPLQGYTK